MPSASQRTFATASLRFSANVWLWLVLGTILVAGFCFVYSRLVCPFICALPSDRLGRNIALVSILHFGLRQYLLSHPIRDGGGRTAARVCYLRSVMSWLVAGALAIGLHYSLYPSFPLGSHFKFAIGYWGLGGGLCTQLEYLMYEQELPSLTLDSTIPLRERLRDRLIEGYVIFTLTPAVVLLLTLLRVVRELKGTTQHVVEATMLTVVFTGMALLAALLFGRSLRRDSERLMEAVRKVSQGDFSPAVRTTRADELAQVADGINQMASGLLLRERIREAFGRFVSPQVASEFIEKYAKSGRAAELGGERRDAVILFSDLRDFTPLSESLPPERLIEVLNGYFAKMVSAIHQHHGMVDKFIGDAVLAVFGLSPAAPGSNTENAAVQAVRAAQKMHEELALYNDTLREQGIVLSSGIGIHAGEVVAGYLGTHDRLEYTVIGHNVNVAARLESKARAPLPSLLFSEEVARRIGETLPVRSAGEVQLKGVSNETRVFTVESPSPLNPVDRR